MVCGTGSDVGKTHIVTGLCRALARRGVRVSPFKAQNMALNSYVTPCGHEIGRAQAIQALAAGATPEPAMNPILLKPAGGATSQVVLMGSPAGHVSLSEYQEMKPALLGRVLDALADLRSRFDVVILEGAGSAAETNLLDQDIVNLRVAAESGANAIVVGDIDRGGVFASLFGTLALLPDRYRSLVRGFVINKFRGDPALLASGVADLEERCAVPVIGVVPFTAGVTLDAEDSLALDGWRQLPPSDALADALDVAVVRLPHLSNFTDLDAVALEPGVSVRLVDHPSAMGDPDLIVLPGTKATVADLDWLRARSLDKAICSRRASGSTILGVCGGYQMLGTRIVDDVESRCGRVEALGWLDAATDFQSVKITRQRRGEALGEALHGYQIHHGVVSGGSAARPWIQLDDGYGTTAEGSSDGRQTYGTTLHGLFESDGFRSAFLTAVAARRAKRFKAGALSFAAARAAQFDVLGDLVDRHIDMAAVGALIEGAPGT